MALGDAYLNDAIDGIAAAPPRAPQRPMAEGRGSVWGIVSAIPRAVTEAVAQTGAAVVEATKGFGEVLGAYPEALGPVTLTDQQRGQAEAQRQKLLTEGVDVESGVARALRSAGATYRPDPQSATTAEQILYGFARGAAKVVTAAPAGPAGFLMAGTGEAMSAADDLAQQGVPQGARMAAGAVQGAGLALAGLPLIGSTLGRTAALYLAGGPGGFMAQQALTREILRDAGQDQVAEQFDPFDPVGLAVSALVPAGFAAYGLRAQRLQRAAASLPPTLAEARGEAPPVDGGPPPAADAFPGTLTPMAEAAGAARMPQQAVDAAMVMQLAEHWQRADATAAALQSARTPQEAAAALARSFAELAVLEGPRPLPAPAAVADDLRMLADGAGWAQQGGQLIRDVPPIAPNADPASIRWQHQEGDVVGRTTWIPASEWFGRMRNDLGRGGLVDPVEINSAVEKAISGEKMTARERRTVEWMQREVQQLRDRMFMLDDADQTARDAFGEGLSSRDAADIEITSRAAEIDADAVERAAIQFENDDAGFRREMQRIVDGNRPQEQAAAAGTEPDAGAGPRGAEARAAPEGAPGQGLTDDAAGATPPPNREAAPAPGGTGAAADGVPGAGAAADQAAGLSDSRIAAVRQQFPDLMVQMDGMDAPMRLDDFMAAVKAEAEDIAADAPLMQVAAECALLNGL